MKAGIGAQGQPSDAAESGLGVADDSSGQQAAEASCRRDAYAPAPGFAVVHLFRFVGPGNRSSEDAVLT
jgi:hypothetical protein